MDLRLFRRAFRKGDWVVYGRRKFTTHPGRRAHDVDPSANGDFYNYIVDKQWIVIDVLTDGKLLLGTRRKKTHLVDVHDLKLRHATLWDRIRYRHRFVAIQQATVNADS